MTDITVATARYYTILTAVGLEKITAAALSGVKVNITHAAVGDGGGAYCQPTDTQTGLLRECWRGEIQSAELSATVKNMIDVRFTVPDGVGGFFIREMGLFDSGGDLIAVCNTPDVEKVSLEDGVGGRVKMLMHILVTHAKAVRFTVAPAEGGCLSLAFTAAPEDWIEDAETTGKYRFYCDLTDPEITGGMVPLVVFDEASEEAASVAGICRASSHSGFVRLKSLSRPGESLSVVCHLFGQGTPSGGEAATDEEVSAAIGEVFSGSAVASDAEVEQVINDVLGS